MKRLYFIAAALAGSSLIACSTSPLGRKQLMLVPESQMDQMGVQSFQQVKQQTPVETDAALNAYVRCIAEPIAQVVNQETGQNTQWEIAVFKDDTANAFALPGGKIGVNTGLLPVAKTDAQMATVLGHEVGHVLARHGNERVSEGIVEQGGLAALSAAMGNSAQSQTLMSLLGMGAQVGVALPHSRTQESEADKIGLDLMSKAGFNPNESVDLWKNMMAQGGSRPPAWLSDHPADEDRIKSLQERIPQDLPNYERAKASGRNPQCKRP